MLVNLTPIHNTNFHKYPVKTYPNLAPLKCDTVTFSGKLPRDLMELASDRIIKICEKAISAGEIIGEGKEARVFKIEGYPEYCVRQEKKLANNKFELERNLDKYDLVNHVVAHLNEGTTILKYVSGIPIKITDSYNPKNDLKRTIQELLANEFPVVSFKKLLEQVENAKMKDIDFDRFGENILVDPMTHEMVCIDFSPNIRDTSNEYNPISYIYSALDVDNTQHAKRVFGKICDAYARRLFEVPTKNLNLDKLDMHFYHRGFINDPFCYFPDREILHETEKRLQTLIKEKTNPLSRKEKLKTMIEDFHEFINQEIMPVYDWY